MPPSLAVPCAAQSPGAANVVPIWSTEIGSDNGPVSAASGAVVVGTLSDSSRNAEVICVSADTGHVRWSIEHQRLGRRELDNPDSGIRSRPAIDRDRVVYYSNRGEIVCCDLSTPLEEKQGRAGGISPPSVIWRRDLPAEFDVFKRDDFDHGIVAPDPVIHGGRVYCATGNGSTHGIKRFYGDSVHVPSPEAPACVCLSLEDGSVIWTSSAASADVLHSSVASPTLLPAEKIDGESAVAFAGGDGKLRILSDRDGSTLATSAEDVWCWSWCRPVLCGEYLVIATDVPDGLTRPATYSVHGFHLSRLRQDADLRPDWTFDAALYTGTSVDPIYRDGTIYLLSHDGYLLAMNAATGELRWSDPIAYEAGLFAGMAATPQYLIVAVGDSFHAHDTTADRPSFLRSDAPDVIQGGIAILDDLLLFCTRRRLHAVRLRELLPQSDLKHR